MASWILTFCRHPPPLGTGGGLAKVQGTASQTYEKTLLEESELCHPSGGCGLWESHTPLPPRPGGGRSESSQAASAPRRPPASHTSSAAPQRAHSPKASRPPSCHPAPHTAWSRVEGGRAVPWDGAPIPTPAHPERQADACRAGGASAWEPVFCTLGR